MIARIWHGWTTSKNASAYEDLLKQKIFPAIEKKQVKGYRKISLLKRKTDAGVEFITIMLFSDIDAVKEFAGENYEQSFVPDEAKKLLSRHDEFSKHFEIREELNY